MLLSLVSAAAAAEPIEPTSSRGSLTMTFENDAVEDVDRHYTSGFRVAYLFGEGGEPGWLRALGEKLPLVRGTDVHRYEMALGQHIYTPADTDLAVPIPDDRPYAGWLYSSFGIVAKRGLVIYQFEFGIGVVGPASHAEETQTTVHRWIDSAEAQGWDYQLANELTVQCSMQRNWWLVRGQSFGGVKWDVIPHLGGALGNAAIYTNGGLTVSLGSGQPGSYGTPRVGLTLPGNGYFRAGHGFSWQVFASVEGLAIARNLFLDGNTFVDYMPSTVDRRTFVGEVQVGAQVVMDDFRVSYTHILRTREFATQREAEIYGALSFSYQL